MSKIIAYVDPGVTMSYCDVCEVDPDESHFTKYLGAQRWGDPEDKYHREGYEYAIYKKIYVKCKEGEFPSKQIYNLEDIDPNRIIKK